MGNLWCCHDSSYEVLETKEQTTYTKARELRVNTRKKSMTCAKIRSYTLGMYHPERS